MQDHGHAEVVKLLLNAGVNVNVKAHSTGKDLTTLEVTKTKSDAKIVELLKEHGAKA